MTVYYQYRVTRAIANWHCIKRDNCDALRLHFFSIKELNSTNVLVTTYTSHKQFIVKNTQNGAKNTIITMSFTYFTVMLHLPHQIIVFHFDRQSFIINQFAGKKTFLLVDRIRLLLLWIYKMATAEPNTKQYCSAIEL